MLVEPPASGARTVRGTGLRFRVCRAQPVDLMADVGGFRRRIGERDGAIEGNPSLVRTAELFQKCPAGAVKVEIAIQLLGQWLDHGEGSLGPPAHGHRYRAVECDDGRWLHALE